MTVCVLAILQWLGYGLDFPSAKFGRILLETSFIPIVVLAVGILMAKLPGIKAWADYRRRVQEFKEKYPDVDLKALGRMTPKSEATKSR